MEISISSDAEFSISRKGSQITLKIELGDLHPSGGQMMDIAYWILPMIKRHFSALHGESISEQVKDLIKILEKEIKRDSKDLAALTTNLADLSNIIKIFTERLNKPDDIAGLKMLTMELARHCRLINNEKIPYLLVLQKQNPKLE